MKKNKKGQISLYIVFIFAALTLITIATVFAAMGTLFNTKMYLAGQDILNRSAEDIGNINDVTIRNKINDSTHDALDSVSDNVEVTNSIFQYSWIIILVLLGIIVLIYSRRSVEYGGLF